MARIEIVDSHAHLDMEEFDEDRQEVIQRALEAGIKTVLCPIELTHPKSSDVILGLKKTYPQVVAAAGVHPHQAKLFRAGHLEEIRALAAGRTIQALGEVGLDFHYNFSSKKDQVEAFRSQLKKVSLPDLAFSTTQNFESLLTSYQFSV